MTSLTDVFKGPLLAVTLTSATALAAAAALPAVSYAQEADAGANSSSGSDSDADADADANASSGSDADADANAEGGNANSSSGSDADADANAEGGNANAAGGDATAEGGEGGNASAGADAEGGDANQSQGQDQSQTAGAESQAGSSSDNAVNIDQGGNTIIHSTVTYPDNDAVINCDLENQTITLNTIVGGLSWGRSQVAGMGDLQRCNMSRVIQNLLIPEAQSENPVASARARDHLDALLPDLNLQEASTAFLQRFTEVLAAGVDFDKASHPSRRQILVTLLTNDLQIQPDSPIVELLNNPLELQQNITVEVVYPNGNTGRTTAPSDAQVAGAVQRIAPPSGESASSCPSTGRLNCQQVRGAAEATLEP